MSDKSLMTEINKHTRNIDKNVSRFGTKLPGNDNKEQEQTLQELSYEQMIMGTLASLTFGIKNIKKDTQVKQLLSRQNIFDLVKTISYNSTATKNILANIVKNNKSYYDKIIPIITKIGNGTNDESTQNEIKNKIQIEGNGFKDLTELLKELQNDKLNKNVFINIDSLITVLSKLGNADFDKLEEAAKKNLIKLRNLIINNSGSLGDIIEQISEMVKDKDISANIMSLSDIIDTIIHILEIDPTKINLMGLQTLVQITDPKTGLIAQLLAQLQDATNEIKLNKDNFISLETFFNSLASLTDIGFIKRRRIKNNIQFINKYIIDEIPNILDKIREVADDNQESAYTAINNLTALFSAITEISGMKLNDRVRLLMNLKFVKDIYLKEIIDILDQFKNVINGDFTSVVQALDSITRVFDMILKIGDISMIKIMKISFKTDVISDILQDSIESLLDIILEMKQVDEALNKIMDIEKVFNAIKIIYSDIPGLGSSFKASLALSMLMSNVTQINELIDVLNNLEKFKRQQTIEQTLPRLINNLMKLFEFEGDSKRKLEDTNYLIIYFKDNIVKNLSKTIENLNNIPALKNSNVWLKSLKTILKEFDSGGTDAGEDSVGSLLYNIPSEDILKNFLKFGTSLKLVVTTITSINKLDEEQQQNIEAMLSVTKTVVGSFNADDEETIGGLLKHIDSNNLEKIDSLITVLKKLSELNKVKIVLNISAKSIEEFSKVAEPLKSFFEKLSSIKKEDIDNTNEAFNAFMKIVIGGASILIIGSLTMMLVKPSNLILFTLSLGAFLTALGLVFRLVHKGFKESMKGAKDAMIITGIGAAIMIFGSWLTSKNFFAGAMIFTLELGIFITAIGLVFMIVNKGFRNTMYGAENAMFIVGAASLIMILGALSSKLYSFYNVMLFVGELSIFLLALGGIFLVINKLFDGTYKSIKNALLVVAMSSLIMIGAQLIYDYLSVTKIFGFVIILGGFLIALGYAYKIAGNLMKHALKDILLCVIVTSLSIALMYFIGKFMENHAMYLLYAIGFAVGFGIFIVIIGGICALLSTFSGYIYTGALVMGAIMVVTLLAVGVMYIMYKVFSQEGFYKKIMNGIVAMAVVFTFFTGLIAVLGVLVFGPQAALFAAGAVALVILCGVAYLAANVIQSIAYAVKALKETNVTKTDIVKMKDVIIGFGDIVNTLIDVMPWNPLKIIKLIAITNILEKTSKALASIARSIKEYSTMKFASEFDSNGKPKAWISITHEDFPRATKHIGELLTCVTNALLSVAKEHPELFDEGIFIDSPAMNAAKVAKKMGDALGSIAKGVKDWVNMRIPAAYYSDGTVKEWITLKDSDFTQVGKNIEAVLTCLGKAIVASIDGHPELFGTKWYDIFGLQDSPAMNAAKSIKIMGDTVNEIAMTVAGYASGLMPVYDKDGKLAPKDMWIKFDLDEMKNEKGKVYQAIHTILLCLGKAIVDVVNSDEAKEIFDDGWFSQSYGKDASESMLNMAKAVNETIEAIKKISDMKLDVDPSQNFDKIKQVMRNTISGMISVLSVFQEERSDVDSYDVTIGENTGGWLKNKIKGASQAIGLDKVVNGIQGLFGVNKTDFNSRAKAKRNIVTYVKRNIDDIKEVTDALNSIQSVIHNLIQNVGNFTKSFKENEDALNIKSSYDIIGIINNKIMPSFNSIRLLKLTDDEFNIFKKKIDRINAISTSVLNTINKNAECVTGYEKLYNENKNYFDNKTNISIARVINSILKDFNDIANLNLNTVSINKFKRNDSGLNTIIALYTNTLNKIIRLIKSVKNTIVENNNVLRDGIFSIFDATNDISNDERFSEYVDDLERFVQVISSIKLDKINEFTSIVTAMNNLSDNLSNMDKLSDTLSNKLTIVLFELVEQLRKAEATVENAHILQEKRKQLMDESINKMQNIMNKHMIVEIYQGTQQKSSNDKSVDFSARGSINGSPIDSTSYDSGDNSSDMGLTNVKLENPENAQAKKGSGNIQNNEEAMSFFEFKTYMENDFINNFRNSGNS